MTSAPGPAPKAAWDYGLGKVYKPVTMNFF